MNWKHVLIVVRFRDQGVFLVIKPLFLSSGFQLEIGIRQNFAHIMSEASALCLWLRLLRFSEMC